MDKSNRKERKIVISENEYFIGIYTKLVVLLLINIDN